MSWGYIYYEKYLSKSIFTELMLETKTLHTIYKYIDCSAISLKFIDIYSRL